MTEFYTFEKAPDYFNTALLMDELFVAFPAWRGGGEVEDLLKLRSNSDKSRVTLAVPDGTGQTLLQTIIDAHDGSQLTASQKARLRRINAKTQMSNVANLGTVSVAQAENWIENNVNDLASAKEALKKLAAMTIALRNHIFSELEGQ